MPTAAIGLAFSLFAFWGAAQGDKVEGLNPVELSIVLMLTAVPLYFLRPKARSTEQPA
jgi:APA family basic amino acid/polyamine antiporter